MTAPIPPIATDDPFGEWQPTRAYVGRIEHVMLWGNAAAALVNLLVIFLLPDVWTNFLILILSAGFVIHECRRIAEYSDIISFARFCYALPESTRAALGITIIRGPAQ